MANICDSRITITGPSDDRIRLLLDIGASDAVGDWMHIDFDQVIPSPQDADEHAKRLWRREHWGVARKPQATGSHLLDPSEAAADSTVLMLATEYAPPIPIFEALAARYRRLTFDVAYVLEFTEAAGYLRLSEGSLQISERAEGEADALALLDRYSPELADSQRSISE